MRRPYPMIASPLPMISPLQTTSPIPNQTPSQPMMNHPNGPKPGSLGAVVGSFKSAVTKRINQIRTTPVWQRNYYEHIIRSEKELNQIRAYIEHNPANWQTDSLKPLNK